MRLGDVSIENFMSVRKARVSFDRKGLVLIQGDNNDSTAFESNGSGKSTLFTEAPCWALFGETIRGQKGDSVVNNKVKKGTVVNVQVFADSGDVYNIIRHRKHKEHKNHVLLYKNGNNITGKSDKETDQMIEDLLEMDFLTFTNSTMFGQGISKMFAISTDSEQKKILERMLQMDIYRTCQDLAKEYLKKSQDRYDKVSSTIDSFQDKKKVLDNTIFDLQEKEATLSKSVEAKVLQITNEINDSYAELMSIPDSKQNQESMNSLDEAMGELQRKIDSYNEYKASRNDLNNDLRILKRDISVAENDLQKLNKQLTDIKAGKNIPKICSECGQELPLDDTTKIENHLGDSIKKKLSALDSMDDEVVEIEGLISKLDTVLSDVEPLIQQYNSLSEEKNDLRSIIRSNETLKTQIKKRIDGLKKQKIEQEELLQTTYTDLIEDTVKQARDVERQIGELQASLEHLSKDIKGFQFWVNGFGNQGIKSVMLDSVTPFLNKRANSYLSKLTDSTVEVKFNTQTETKSGEKRDKFSVEISNISGDDDYKGNSGGEKRRIDIAINMALQDLVSSRSNKSIDLVVYDECFEGLDAVGCENVIELLKEKAKVFGTVYVITHNDNLKQLFSNTVTVSKTNSVTEVAYE